MQAAIVTYDLDNVKPDDNHRVKAALESFTNTLTEFRGQNVFSRAPQQIRLSLPDTTVVVGVNDPTITSAGIAGAVAGVIKSVGATASRIYVAPIDLGSDFLVNPS